ncbi:hypothetical protein [Actinomadura sp. B10D3]|uniref:hypothetical protein n=1 Tax=Actinomadura sp. B10D3 TaxID=3153557 RepID=UPI00325E7B11
MLEGVRGSSPRDHERNAINERRARALFENPDLARAVVQRVDADGESRPKISSILLDNATIDHAMRYFEDARWERARAGRSTRPRLTMLAVAEFVNALILYDHVLTGPEAGVSPHTQVVSADHTSRAALSEVLGDAADVIRIATENMAWPEVLALLGLAKATSMAAVSGRDQGQVNAVNGQSQVDRVSALLDRPLDPDRVFADLKRLTPRVAYQSPHKMGWIASDHNYYPRNFSTLLLAGSQVDATSIDAEDGAGYWADHEAWFYQDATPERFAAQLIYRAQVYSLLADLIGCPYSADALRAELVKPHTPPRFAERVTALVGDAEAARDDQINRVLGYEAFKVRIPLVLKYVLSRASRPTEVLEITLETRDSRRARRFREYCGRVDAAIAEGKRAEVLRACEELSAFGIQFETELAEGRPARDQVVGAAKDLVSIGSPMLGALIPGAAIAGGLVGGWVRRRRYALIEQLAGAPRTLNEIEQEFAHLWPHL